ncbi:ankyrin repeat domain-containing protein [bacterium]|nr:ankyrin repeat domain-containing protein [bacterium]
MSVRVQGPKGMPSVLPDGANLRGMQLAFQEFVGAESRYRGSQADQVYLVRELPVSQAGPLRWEYACLKRLQHPLLPDLVEAFEETGFAYLVTQFPQGFRLDQKIARKNLNPVECAQCLSQLLDYLGSQQVGIELAGAQLIKTRADKLKLIDLTFTRDGADLSRDRQALANCLSDWFHESIPDLIDTLRKGESLALGRVAMLEETGGHRIPLPQDPRRTCLSPGTRVANYQVEFLTQGGMSLCYLSKNGSDTRFLKEVRLDNVEGAAALRREFDVMRKLKHPNIVCAHQLFEQAGYLYLVMDFVEGSTLAEVSRRGPVSEEQLLDWGQQLCQTLDYLHNQTPPMIYRDVKPGNVVHTPAGKLYLIDFGLTRTYKAGQAKDTQALGTFSTASPEHFKGQTDARSDIFSLGATLYLLAHPTFKPTAPFVFPALRKAQPQFSGELESLIRRCLESKPEARWSSAKALAAEIRILQEPYLKAAPPPTPQASIDDLDFIPNLTGHLATGARQLATRVQSGSALLEALESLASDAEIQSLALLWESLAAQIKSGQAFSAALKLYPRVFSKAYVTLIEGNQKGHLLEGLQQGAELMEKEDRARRTRPAASSEPTPLAPDDPRRGRIVGGLLLILLGLGVGFVTQLASDSFKTGCSASLGFGIAAVSLWAFVDARRLRLMKKTQNLVEDAWTSFALGETDKAEKELGEALLLSRDRLGARHLNTLASLHSLANLCRERKQHKRADEYYSQALAIYQHILPDTHLARANLHRHWAMNFEGQKDRELALDQLEKCLAVLQPQARRYPLELAQAQFYKGKLHFDLGQDTQAMELLSQSLEIQYSLLGLKSPLVHTTMSYLTRVYVRQRLFKQSESHLAILLSEGEQDLVPNYEALAEANLDMGMVRLEQGRTQDAEPYFLRALQLLQHYVGPYPRLLQRVLNGYSRIFGTEGQSVVQLISIFTGDREVLRQALERHPELVNARDNTGWGPIQWATFIGREDIVRWLLARGADPGYDSGLAMGALHVACAWDRPEALFALLEKDPDVNAKGPGGWTPLFWCCLTGQTRLLEHLLKKGADVNRVDDRGCTALHVAASNNRLKALAALLGAGAQVNAQEARGQASALHMAAERGHLGVCDCLIFNGADLTLRDVARQTPLDLALKNHHALLTRAMRKHLQDGLGKSQKARKIASRQE